MGLFVDARTVDEKYDGLGFRAVLGLRNIGGEIIDYFDPSCGCTLVHFARQTAGGHSDICRHGFQIADIYKACKKDIKRSW